MMPFTGQLRACHERLVSVCAGLPAPYPAFTLFFSVSDGESRAHVLHVRADSLAAAWEEGSEKIRHHVQDFGMAAPWLRIDWVEGASETTWAHFKAQLHAVTRNYFRYGLAFDRDFALAFTEQELNANAMLYGDGLIAHAAVNEGNFEVYGKARFHRSLAPELAPEHPVFLLTTGGVFCQPDGVVHKLAGTGLDAGRRQVQALTAQSVLELVRDGASFLGRQVQDDGLFVHGYFPCFDRRIPNDTTLRHASALYAMVEAWELTHDDALRAAIERSITQLTAHLIRACTLPDGQQAAFLVDAGEEIKLGGNAVCLLALVKYSEAMATARWLPLLEKLALGIGYLQDPATGRFNHVLHASDLTLKQATTRTINYDGEAAFGLMRLYGLTRDPRWLAMVQKAFEYFIARQHWQAHDHWLSLCVNELTRWCPHEKYFRFGIQNVAGYLDFVLDRKTTFPTLLELMLAARQMLHRLEGTPAMRHLLGELDIEKFNRALDYRAHYLLNGVFWPEVAMYFKKPSRILGAFFIRHHSFRVRIDDVAHYLSGFVAYHRYLRGRPVAPAQGHGSSPDDAAPWTAAEMASVTGGEWISQPHDGWRATGVAQRSFLREGRVVFTPQATNARRPETALKNVLQPAAAVICTNPELHADERVPVLRVPSVRQAVLDLGAHARHLYAGQVFGVTGVARAGVADMLAHVLASWGEVGRPEGNVNMPNGIAWNMTCMPRHVPYWVLEMATASMPASAYLVRPTQAIMTGPSATALGNPDLSTAARKERNVFLGMAPGASVVLRRDMKEFETFATAARAQQLDVVSFGAHQDADFRLLSFEHGELHARMAGEDLRFQLSTPGRDIGMCAMAVLAALHVARFPQATVVEALARFESAAGRGALHTIRIGRGSFRLIDETQDANPASMKAALERLSEAPCPPARRVAILGDMQDLGPSAQHHHIDLALPLLASQPDRVLLCGPLMKALHTEVQTRVRSHWFVDVADLSAALGDILRPDDWVLAKSSAGLGLARVTRALRAMP